VLNKVRISGKGRADKEPNAYDVRRMVNICKKLERLNIESVFNFDVEEKEKRRGDNIPNLTAMKVKGQKIGTSRRLLLCSGA